MDVNSEQLEAFRSRARAWLAENAAPGASVDTPFGVGCDSLALFPSGSEEEEAALVDAGSRWLQRKADAGFANLSWDPEWGGAGLTRRHDQCFAEEEARVDVPRQHDVVSITTALVAPTIRAVGTAAQRERFLRPMLRCEELWCQLFSEPGAGSDLASVQTRATRSGDLWTMTGQKVWTSGARFADWGYVLCRTDAAAPKHRGLTAFAVPMRSPGIEVRPLRQMTGGASFNEVFLTDVEVPDEFRLGEAGDGWRVALTTLGFERGGSSDDGAVRTVARLIALASHLGADADPVIRQHLARAYSHQLVSALTGRRVRSRLRAGDSPGPEGSIGKLFATNGLALFNAAAEAMLGPRLAADTGQWGCFAWTEHVLGTPGWRIAGGTDEVQRNIIAERVLGLPAEPRPAG